MRFALLGDHPDGVAAARGLTATGRYEFVVCSGPAAVADELGGGRPVPVVGDVEEVLADPAVELVIVAGPPSTRPEQLRRALQSERHVLCVHPADSKPDLAHEAAMIQADTGRLLLPLLPEALHPALGRLAELAGPVRLVVLERHSPLVSDEPRPALPGWDVLRRLGGDIAELSAFTAGDELTLAEPVTLAGRFQNGGQFQALLVPGQPSRRWHLRVLGGQATAELCFPDGFPGPARLCWQGSDNVPREETWPAWDPGPALAAVLEAARAGQRPAVTWSDAIRALELDDAARQSVHRRRSSLMEYQEASEEVGFKGTMTLVGCGLLWSILLLLILSRWKPWLGFVILPVLVLFLGLQLLRWVIPGRAREARGSESRPDGRGVPGPDLRSKP
jgi:predicted dehydrogenase